MSFAFTDATIWLGGYDFTGDSNELSLALSADELDATPFGSTFRKRIAGLRNTEMTVGGYWQSAATDAVDPQVFPNLGVADRVVTLAPAAVPRPLNANPFFETDVANWQVAGGTFVRSTAQFHEGTASALFTPDGVTVGPSFRTNDVIPASPGVTYRISAWMRSAVTRTVFLKFHWLDAGGAPITTDGVVVNLIADTWVLGSHVATAPALTARAHLGVDIGGTPLITELLYIDEAQLTTAQTTTAYMFQGAKFSYSMFGAIGEVTPFTLGAKGSNGVGTVRGQVAKAKANVSATGPTGSGVNLGAVGATQFLYATFHVFGTPGTTITVIVESDDNAGFTTPTTVATIGPLTAAGGTWATRAAGPITDTWYRFNITAITGTFQVAGAIGIR